jgi:hypothetical protein
MAPAPDPELAGRMLPTTPVRPNAPQGSAWRGLVTLLLVVLGPFVAWTLAFSVASIVSSPNVPDPCHSSTWGCELSPQEGMALVGLVCGAVIVPVVTLGLGIVTLLRPADRRRQTVVRGVTGFVVVAVVLAGVAVGTTLA